MKKKFKNYFLNLDLMLFCILTAIFITIFVSPWIHQMDVNRYQLDLVSGLDKATIAQNYQHLSGYLWLFHREALYLPDFVMSKQGAIHFADVKVLVDSLQILWIVTGIIGLFGTVKRLKQKDIQFLKETATLLIVVPLGIGFLAWVNFERAFVMFHQLFFSNNYWIFDITLDPVILILPEEFFMHCFFAIVVFVLLLAGLLYALYKYRIQTEILKISDSI